MPADAVALPPGGVASTAATLVSRPCADHAKAFVPVLRELGFKGSFPHFRRFGPERVDVLTFQFSSWGGSFVVEIGACPPQGFESCGELIPAEKVKVLHLYRRMRLGAKDEHSDHWFNFEKGNYAQVANAVVPFIRDQGETWWKAAGPGVASDRVDG